MKNMPILFYTDDDQDDLMVFEVAASGLGADTNLFDDGNKLMYSLNNPPPVPSIVFVDLNMPLKSGYEILHEMKASERLKGIPVVVLSTATDKGNIDKSRKAGADYYIPKPTSVEKLRKAIAHTMTMDWNAPKSLDASFVYQY
jgi:CheY-like chemotaxis protein